MAYVQQILLKVYRSEKLAGLAFLSFCFLSHIPAICLATCYFFSLYVIKYGLNYLLSYVLCIFGRRVYFAFSLFCLLVMIFFLLLASFMV